MILRCYRWLILALFAYGANGQDTDEEDEATAHFNDPRGRLSWVIDDTSLPWVGSYNFLGSSISHSTVLLSVFDSSAGIKLGECSTKSFPHAETFTAIPPIMKGDVWQKVVFRLQADSLQCNVSDSETHFQRIAVIHQPRSFSVRILAARGPKCIRGLIVQNEIAIGCPPILERNNFSSHNFSCGCPNTIPDQWNSQVSFGSGQTKSAEVKPSSPVEFPIFQLTDEDEDEDTTAIPIKASATTFRLSSLLPNLNIQTLPPGTVMPEKRVSPGMFVVTSHPCLSYICQNNGTCTVDTRSQPRCVCQDGFTGRHCEIDLCAEFGCQHGGTCHIFSGQPVCQCPPGTTGPKCDQAVCDKPCENGGQCIFMNSGTVCQCLNGFVGGNCNVKDVCQNSSICSVYGSVTRCQLEPHSYTLSPNETTDAAHECLCLDEKNSWVDCMNLALARQAASLTTLAPTTTTIATPTTSRIETTSTRPTILLVPSSTLAPATELQSKENIKNENLKENSRENHTGFITGRKHPLMNRTISVENTIDQEDYSTERGSPEFPLTNIPTTDHSEEEVSESTISTTASPEPPTFSQLPDLSSVFTTEETVSTTTSDYEEEGFESVTHHVSSEVEVSKSTTFAIPVYSTYKPITPSPWPTSSKSIEIGDIDNRIEEATEIPHREKFPSTPEEEEIIIIQTSTNPNFVVDKGIVDFGEENVRTNQQPTRNRESSTGATTLSWIIAISAVVALLLLISGSGLFVLRYVKRSRRLHGKYNPAREENMVASTYSMPMTSVSKEERLI